MQLAQTHAVAVDAIPGTPQGSGVQSVMAAVGAFGAAVICPNEKIPKISLLPAAQYQTFVGMLTQDLAARRAAPAAPVA